MKKIISILLAVLMITSQTAITAIAADYQQISAGEKTTVQIETAGEEKIFKFVPAKSGEYIISSLVDENNYYRINPYCCLYDANMEKICSDSYSGSGNNFLLFCQLNAGETYYFGIGDSYDKICTFDIELKINPIKSIEVLSVYPVYEYANGRWDTDDGVNYYFKYDVPPFSYKINYIDGTSEVFNSKTGICTAKTINTADGCQVEVSYGSAKAVADVPIKPTYNFKFIVQNGGAIITEFIGNGSTVNIPAKIAGYNVIGVNSLTKDYNNYRVEKIIVPDGVKFLSDNWCKRLPSLKEIELGKDVSSINYKMFTTPNKIYDELKSIKISVNNQNFKDVGGVVYSKDGTRLVFYPIAKGAQYTIPSTVSNFDIIYDKLYTDVNFDIDSADYTTVDDVLYSKDMKKVIRCNTEKTGDYVMPNSVTSIAENAFRGCSDLENVTVSSNITDIVYAAFAECTSLKSVSLPTSITSIGGYAFSDCHALKDFTVGSNVTEIGQGAFNGCTSLTDFTIPANVKSLGNSVLSNCTSLVNLRIADGVKTLGNSCFAGCTSLKSVTIPSSIEFGDNVYTWIFSDCTALENITFADGIKYIPQMFNDCTNLSSITIPDSVEKIDESFYDTKLYATKSNWVNGVLYIGNHLIKANSNNIYGNYIIKNGTRTISSDAFSYCDNLKSVTIPDSIKAIEDSTFSCCSSLEKVNFGKGIKTIGDRAFVDCTKLVVDLPASVSKIGYRAFAESNNSKLVIPDTVTEIVYGAFMGSSSLSEIQMPDKLVSLGGRTFHDTPWYDNQPNGSVYLGKMLYSYKGTAPQSVTVEPGTLGISAYAFENQTSMTNVVLPDGLIEIGTGAFLDCYIHKIEIPQSVTSIKPYAIGYFNMGDYGLFYTHTKLDINDCKYNRLDDLVIVGAAGSEAERYAKENGFAFETATNHTYVKKSQTTKATQKADGKIVTQEKCKVCNKVKSSKTTVIPKVSTIALQKTTIGYNWYYTGKQITPTVTVKDRTGKALKRGTDYSLTYDSGRVKVGKYSIKVTLKGNYSGTKTFTFEIVNRPVNKWIKSGNRWWYRHADGSYTRNNWEKISGKWYHFDKSGWMQTGWLKDGGKWYYLNSSGAMTTGWVKVSNKWYYMNSSGVMQTGWVKLSGKWYYLNSSGAMVTGRQKIGNKYYTFNSSGVWVK